MAKRGTPGTSIVLDHVAVCVGHRQLFEVRSQTFPAGSVTGVKGPNGMGKTTLLRLMAGLARPASGLISFSPPLPPQRKRLVGESPQAHGQLNPIVCYFSSTPALLLDQTVAQNLEFYCNSFSLLPRRSDFLQSLKESGLDGRAEQVARSLSTGQKRRLTFSALELLEPAVLITDEPSNGLDREGQQLCQKALCQLAERGACVVVATHDEEILSLCQSVLDLPKLLQEAEGSAANGAGQVKRPLRLL